MIIRKICSFLILATLVNTHARGADALAAMLPVENVTIEESLSASEASASKVTYSLYGKHHTIWVDTVNTDLALKPHIINIAVAEDAIHHGVELKNKLLQKEITYVNCQKFKTKMYYLIVTGKIVATPFGMLLFAANINKKHGIMQFILAGILVSFCSWIDYQLASSYYTLFTIASTQLRYVIIQEYANLMKFENDARRDAFKNNMHNHWYEKATTPAERFAFLKAASMREFYKGEMQQKTMFKNIDRIAQKYGVRDLKTIL